MNAKIIKKNLSGNTKQLHIRITSKQRLGLEIIRRKKHRSISSLVVRLIEDEMKNMLIRHDLQEGKKKTMKSSRASHVKKSTTVKHAAHKIYDRHQPDQFVAFALHFPHLLNPIEKELWSLIKNNPFFWETRASKNKNRSKPLIHSSSKKTLKRELLRKHWEPLNHIAQDFYHQQLCEL